jgi:homoserine/homoserine lactone efflux protein
MSWQVWWAFAVTETVLCVVPGPAVVLVLSKALRYGTARSIWSILGIVAANTLYFGLSATGIGAVLSTSYQLFFAIKWIGVLYLLWVGLSTFFGKAQGVSGLDDRAAQATSRGLFGSGFLLQMSNPKALIFFSALLPQFIDPSAALWPQLAILALTSVIIEFVVQLFYAVLAGRAANFAMRDRFVVITNRISGTALMLAGLGMAAVRRT